MANRMHLLCAVALGAVALSSCNGGSGNTAATAAPAAGAYSQQPGNYETTIRITEASLQGFPPEMQQQIDQARQQPMTQTQCIPFGFSMDSMSLRNLRFTLPQNIGGCNVAEVKLEGGSMSGSLSCEIRNLPQGRPDAPRAINASMTYSGTYSADTYNMTIQGEATEPGNDSRRGNVKVEIASRRVGDCPAGGSVMAPPRPTYAPTPPSDPSGNMSTDMPEDTMTNTTE
jgi:hypothetical protein